jgi:hypothetical protein
MVTVINETPQSNDSGTGIAAALIILVILVVAAVLWGGPILRTLGFAPVAGSPNSANININGAPKTGGQPPIDVPNPAINIFAPQASSLPAPTAVPVTTPITTPSGTY